MYFIEIKTQRRIDKNSYKTFSQRAYDIFTDTFALI